MADKDKRKLIMYFLVVLLGGIAGGVSFSNYVKENANSVNEESVLPKEESSVSVESTKDKTEIDTEVSGTESTAYSAGEPGKYQKSGDLEKYMYSIAEKTKETE